jgi:hypothetical protein
LFNLPGKKVIQQKDTPIEVVVLDVAEPEIERPKKNKKNITVASKDVIH